MLFSEAIIAGDTKKCIELYDCTITRPLEFNVPSDHSLHCIPFNRTLEKLLRLGVELVWPTMVRFMSRLYRAECTPQFNLMMNIVLKHKYLPSEHVIQFFLTEDPDMIIALREIGWTVTFDDRHDRDVYNLLSLKNIATNIMTDQLCPIIDSSQLAVLEYLDFRGLSYRKTSGIEFVSLRGLSYEKSEHLGFVDLSAKFSSPNLIIRKLFRTVKLGETCYHLVKTFAVVAKKNPEPIKEKYIKRFIDSSMSYQQLYGAVIVMIVRHKLADLSKYRSNPFVNHLLEL